MLVGFAEGLGAAKTYAAQAHYEIDANRELLGLGAANLASGCASGMVVNGSLSKTAVNGGAGAQSQISGLVVAALTVVTLLFLTGLFEQLPEATLAAVVIAAVIELVDVAALRRLYRVYTARLGRDLRRGGPAGLHRRGRGDARRAGLRHPARAVHRHRDLAAAAASTARRGRTSPSSAASAGRRASTATSSATRRTSVPDGIVVLRVEGGLFFANADARARRRVAAASRATPRAVVLDAETMPFVDVTAARMLAELAEDLGSARTSSSLLARDVGQVRDVLSRAGDGPAAATRYPTVQAAVDAVASGAGVDPRSTPHRG